MELRLEAAINLLATRIVEKYGLQIEIEKQILLTEIIAHLNQAFAEVKKFSKSEFVKATHKETYLRPDGGLVYIRDTKNIRRCILVTEAKRQGTNADRELEGKPKQAQGNAIERLRKNMQGIDCLFAGEEITPFVCFGEGCDFADESSILDRVSTMNGFFPLNQIFVDKIYVAVPSREVFKPASLFFREEPWTPEEMLDILWKVCQRSIEYYRDRYGLSEARASVVEMKLFE